MRKRMIIVIGVLVAVIASIAFVKYQQIQTAIAQGASFQPPPEAVTTLVARTGQVACRPRPSAPSPRSTASWSAPTCPGWSRKSPSTPAAHVDAGDVLVRLDTRQEQAQLAAAEAQRDLARLNLDRMRRPARARGSCPRPSSTSRRRRGQAGRGARWTRSAPPSTARRSARRSPAASASARSTSASTWPAATRSCRCRRSTRSTSTSRCRSSRWASCTPAPCVAVTADEAPTASRRRAR